MGFFDMNPEQAQGLLAAGLNMMGQSNNAPRPSNLAQVIGGGFGSYQNTLQALRQQKAEQEERAQMMQMRGLQIEDMQGGMQAKQQQRDLQGRIQARLRGNAQPAAGMPPAAQQVMGALGQDAQTAAPAIPPAAQQAPVAPAAGNMMQDLVARFTSEARIRAEEGDADGANKLLEHAAKFLPEVNKIEVGEQNGKPVNIITYKDGRQEVSQYGVAPKIHFADDGQNTSIPMNGYTGAAMGPGLRRQQTPDAMANNQVAIRGQNMVDARGKEDSRLKALELANGGKAPPGYRWAEGGGSLQAIPGGPGDKLPEAQQKQLVGVNNLSNAIKEYRTQLAGFKAVDALRPDTRAMMGTKYNNMMLQAKEAYNLGVLNGPDFQILQSVITDPRSPTGMLTSKAALDTQASELDRIMQGVAGVSGQARQPNAGGKQPAPMKPGSIKFLGFEG